MKNNFYSLILTLFIFLLFLSCENQKKRQKDSYVPESTESSNSEAKLKSYPITTADFNYDIFNQTDKEIYTNGNRDIACSIIGQINPDSIYKMSITSSASKITQTPSKYLGRVVTFKGEVDQISELDKKVELNKNIQGEGWYTILLLVKNQNTRFGLMTIDIAYYGDIDKIELKKNMSFSGFFVGTYQSFNAYGGLVQGLSMVSNRVSSN